MATSQMHVRITHSALDEDEQGNIILRGRIDPERLEALLVDDYQREVLSPTSINQIMKGFESDGSVPDIDLGMRGGRTREKDDAFILLDDVFIIDGLQRVNAAKRFLLNGGTPRLGATIHFNTTKEWEVERFRILNAERVKVSSNVLARNTRSQYPVVNALYNMCESDNAFVLKGRVCWQQRKQRSHLITAVTMMKALGILHSHLGPGKAHQLAEMVDGLQKTFDHVGRNAYRENVRAFFQIVEDCWGVRTVTYDGASHLRNTFLFTLARVLSNHPTFWRENKLFMELSLLRKLKLFPMQDPTVQHLCGSGGKAGKMLYNLLVDHMNRGKRTKRIVPRQVIVEEIVENGMEEAPSA